MSKQKDILKKKLDVIFVFYTQNELANKIGITQWELLQKLQNDSFDKNELTKISKIYRELYFEKENVPRCNCEELTKNKEMCPVHDKDEIDKIKSKFSNIFEEFNSGTKS